MLDFPLPPPTNCRSVSSLQKWHGFKSMGGCMTGFTQMFHLSRMLSGASNYLPSSGARAQSSESEIRSAGVRNRISARGEQMQDADIAIDLRRLLDTKQEPFVLQDVIWEKRHPVRTQSSRELKFDFNDIISSSGKSQSSKKMRSRDKRRSRDVGFDNIGSSFSQENGKTSSALFKGSKMPAESIVTMPSNHASPYVRKTSQSQQKVSVACKSPVKSPNKKALLMEAAARILEGSNRKTSRSSVRSLLTELDGSKQAQSSSSWKDVLVDNGSIAEPFANNDESPSQSMIVLEENGAECKLCIHGVNDDHFSFVNEYGQNSPSSSFNCDLEATNDAIKRSTQGTIHALDGMPAESKQSMQFITEVPATPQQLVYVQEPNSNFSSMMKMLHETSNTVADASMEITYWHSGQRQSDDQIHQGAEPMIVSENMGGQHRQCDREALTYMSTNLELASNADQSNDKFFREVSIHQRLFNSCERLEHSQTETLNPFHEVSCSGKIPFDYVEHRTDSSSSIAARIDSVNDAHTHVISNIHRSRSGLISLSTGQGKQGSCSDCRSDIANTSENVTSPVLLLCNYSWWTQENVQLPLAVLQNETLNECAGYDFPTASTEGHSVEISEEGNGENDEEDTSTSPEHSYTDEFQQSSPVSVLDAVYDDNSSSAKTFDYFDEGRQKLLESVRRYEMLMHMDLDSLIMMNEEILCHEFEEVADLHSCEESWGNDGHDICAEDHPSIIIGSPNQRLLKYGGSASTESDEFGWCSEYGHEILEDDLDGHSDKSLYVEMLADKDCKGTSELVMDARARSIAERESRLCKALLDWSSEPLTSGVLAELRCSSTSQTSYFRDTSEEVESQEGSVFIDTILQMDLKENTWSAFNEEVEVMKMDLERSLFKALVQELLTDLLYQVSNQKVLT